MERLTAGYVPFGSSFYDQSALGEITARAEAELQAAGIDLIRAAPVVAAGDEQRALAELAAGEWDFLIANVINWVDVRSATRVPLALRERPVAGALPSVRFVPDGGVRALLDQVLSQHCAAAFGDRAPALRALCGLLGIDEVTT